MPRKWRRSCRRREGSRISWRGSWIPRLGSLLGGLVSRLGSCRVREKKEDLPSGPVHEEDWAIRHPSSGIRSGRADQWRWDGGCFKLEERGDEAAPVCDGLLVQLVGSGAGRQECKPSGLLLAPTFPDCCRRMADVATPMERYMPGHTVRGARNIKRGLAWTERSGWCALRLQPEVCVHRLAIDPPCQFRRG